MLQTAILDNGLF